MYRSISIYIAYACIHTYICIYLYMYIDKHALAYVSLYVHKYAYYRHIYTCSTDSVSHLRHWWSEKLNKFIIEIPH